MPVTVGEESTGSKSRLKSDSRCRGKGCSFRWVQRGEKSFSRGCCLSIKYFFDVLDTQLWRSLLYRGVDFEGDILKHPEHLQEAYATGKALVDKP